MLIRCCQLFGSVNQVQSYEKMLLEGLCWIMFFSISGLFRKNLLHETSQKKKENTHTISASVLFSVGLVDKP